MIRSMVLAAESSAALIAATAIAQPADPNPNAATPAEPATPASPATPAADGAAATPATSATPATAAVPANKDEAATTAADPLAPADAKKKKGAAKKPQ